jgi:hypothetical protein
MISSRIMYLRESYAVPGKSNPVGCIAIHLSPPNGATKQTRDVHYQVSVLNPVDTFDRQTARLFARGRLMEKPILISGIPLNCSMHDITAAVMTAIVSNNSLPTRARKSAANWLGFDNVNTAIKWMKVVKATAATAN